MQTENFQVAPKFDRSPDDIDQMSVLFLDELEIQRDILGRKEKLKLERERSNHRPLFD